MMVIWHGGKEAPVPEPGHASLRLYRTGARACKDLLQFRVLPTYVRDFRINPFDSHDQYRIKSYTCRPRLNSCGALYGP